jgi:uncharacterized protein (DUF305 family)
MPELYGNERKDKIRRERAVANRDLLKEKVAHSRTRDALRMARATIAEQAAQIEAMKQLLTKAISEADRDIVPAIVKRHEDSIRQRYESLNVN